MESKERVPNAAFPMPCSDTCSFTFPFPGLDVVSSPPYLPTYQVAFLFSFTLLRHQQEKQPPQPPRSQPEPEEPHLPWGTRGEAGQGQSSTARSAARWKGHAKLQGTGAPSLHMEFSGEQFSWRCSTTFSGMCKHTVCRPVNHSPPGKFSQEWHEV